ncbi:hypothetical protein EBS40_08365 [bacterium]|nr:hypothetical protein [bacterium]
MLKKIIFRPGVSRENTRYASETIGPVNSPTQTVGGWYECDKVRFRASTPEKIGGWIPTTLSTFLGKCRALWAWATLDGTKLTSVGTNLKYYILRGGVYYDITPIRVTVTLTNPFTATNLSSTITVSATAHGCVTGDFVTFSGATGLGGNITASVLNREYQITVVDVNTYTFTATATANTSDTGNGGTVSAAYQINVGPEFQVPLTGWGAGLWGYGTWGIGQTANSSMRLWSQSNFGENLIFGPRGGAIYYWQNSLGVGTRATQLTGGDTPLVQNYVMVSDASRFVMAFGVNDYGLTNQDPMLIRWSDQESTANWTPSATNQAGSLRLSHGSQIITALQSRQEILVWTDSSIYSLQYLGAPVVWGSQILGDNISILSENAASLASGVAYWMGTDKFYKYDGRVNTLRCDLRQYIYSDINLGQAQQIFSGTNEGFNEVWWFYCSANSTTINKYVVYNYLEDVWYYGTMARTAWLDSGILENPIATTYVNTMVNHEVGVDDNINGTPVALAANIQSSEFDIDDGHNFGFIYRMLPDLTFRGSASSPTPQVTMTLIPLANSGAGYNVPQSEGGSSSATVQRIATVPVEEFTGQVFIRVRGRQLVFKIESNQLGTTWQLGAPRIDIRADGRRGS